MVSEGYPLSVTCSQDLGLPSYSRYRPLGELGLFFFWAGTQGQAVLLGLPFFCGPSYGRLILNPHQLPPSPCVQTMWVRAIIIPVSIDISTCRFRLALIAALNRALIMTFGFCARLFRFDDLFGFAFLWSLGTLFIWRSRSSLSS